MFKKTILYSVLATLCMPLLARIQIQLDFPADQAKELYEHFLQLDVSDEASVLQMLYKNPDNSTTFADIRLEQVPNFTNGQIVQFDIPNNARDAQVTLYLPGDPTFEVKTGKRYVVRPGECHPNAGIHEFEILNYCISVQRAK